METPDQITFVAQSRQKSFSLKKSNKITYLIRNCVYSGWKLLNKANKRVVSLMAMILGLPPTDVGAAEY